MKKADKYPTIDPRLPDLYGRILKAADAMRRARRLEDDVERMMMRVRLAAAATARQKMEDAEPVTILLQG